jgi:hypothetical protein
MTADFRHIHVFRTNVRSHEDKHRLGHYFSTVPGIIEWSVDLEDVDCVLRVVSHSMLPADIIASANDLGFECAELE